MDTTTMIYQEMNRSIIVELEDKWGKEKFQEWYEETVIPLNGKVEVTPQLYHQLLESELHYIEFELQAADWTEQHYSERP